LRLAVGGVEGKSLAVVGIHGDSADGVWGVVLR
jgi:hypothetical protein